MSRAQRPAPSAILLSGLVTQGVSQVSPRRAPQYTRSSSLIESGPRAYWRATLALSLGSILIFANLYTPQPLLPLLRAGFGVTELQASLCVTISTLTLGLSLLIYGQLSDGIGRRPLMLVTMALATLCTLAIPFAADFNTLLDLRAWQGLFLGGLPAVALAYMGTSSRTMPCCSRPGSACARVWSLTRRWPSRRPAQANTSTLPGRTPTAASACRVQLLSGPTSV